MVAAGVGGGSVEGESGGGGSAKPGVEYYVPGRGVACVYANGGCVGVVVRFREEGGVQDTARTSNAPGVCDGGVGCRCDSGVL